MALPSSSAPRRVAILVYDGVTLLDVAGPAEAFQTANRFGADYQIVLVSPRVRTSRRTSGSGYQSIAGLPLSSHRTRIWCPAPTAIRARLCPETWRRPHVSRQPEPAASRRSAPARSSSPPPGSSTASVRPRTGRSRPSSPPDARRAASSPTRSTSVTAARTPRRE